MALDSTLRLRQRLAFLARRETRIDVTMGLLRTSIAVLVFAGAFFLVDWLFLLSTLIRGVMLLGALGAAVWFGREYLYRPMKTVRNEETVALQIESRFPELRDRLISVVQLTAVPAQVADAPVSSRLIEQLEMDTANLTSAMDFSQVINRQFVMRLILVAGAFFVLAAASTVAFPGHVSTVLKRMVFANAEYPTRTTLKILSPPLRVVAGEDWTLQAELGGRIPREVIARVQPRGGNWTRHRMNPELGFRYALTIEKAQESFSFQVLAGDARSRVAAVEVIPPVCVLDPTLDVTAPAYVGGAPRLGLDIQGARVLEGSRVDIVVPCTKPVKTARLIPQEGAPLELRPMTDGNGARGSFVLTAGGPDAPKTAELPVVAASSGLLSFRFEIVDKDGLKNPEPRAAYAIKVVEDGRPSAVIVSPKGQQSSLALAEWQIHYRISDDYGLDRAWLCWRVAKTEPAETGQESQESQEKDGSGTSGEAAVAAAMTGWRPLSVDKGLAIQQQTVALPIALTKAEAGNTVEVWILVADGRVSGEIPKDRRFVPGLSHSEAVSFRIVDEAEKLKNVQERLSRIEEDINSMYDGQRRAKIPVDQIKERLK
jgi:hypothetical protein